MYFEMLVIINGREVSRKYDTLEAMRRDYKSRYASADFEIYFTKKDLNGRILKDYFWN